MSKDLFWNLLTSSEYSLPPSTKQKLPRPPTFDSPNELELEGRSGLNVKNRPHSC